MPAPSLSVIIPAYNEETRIEPFLKEVIAFKQKTPYFKELIAVNDGSSDSTQKILEKYKDKISIIAHKKNMGKGAAIKTGVLAANMDFIVFLDADGSIPVYELPKMYEALKKFSVVAGSRRMKESRVLIKQPPSRIFAGKAFNLIVNILFPRLKHNDNLCGFKGMRRQIGKKIASRLISNGWVFDVEILVRTKKLGEKFGVIPIDWQDKPNSKMKLGLTTIRMFLQLLRLRLSL